MSVLDITSENFSLCMGDMYTASFVYGKVDGEFLRLMQTINFEKSIIKDFNACPVQKWPTNFLNSVKSHLNHLKLDSNSVTVSSRAYSFMKGANYLNFVDKETSDFLWSIIAIKKSGTECPDLIVSGNYAF